MGCPEYIESDEIKQLIQILLDERGDLFGDLKKYFWTEMTACGLRVDKEAPKKQKWTLKIEGVRGSKTLLNGDVKYLIHGYKTMWDGCSSEKKIAHVANMMKRIEFPTPDELQKLAEKGEEYEMGKTRQPDIQDFSSFLTAFGISWADEGTQIPSLIDNKTIEI